MTISTILSKLLLDHYVLLRSEQLRVSHNIQGKEDYGRNVHLAFYVYQIRISVTEAAQEGLGDSVGGLGFGERKRVDERARQRKTRREKERDTRSLGKRERERNREPGPESLSARELSANCERERKRESAREFPRESTRVSVCV